jgi:uncharacterized membrane protein
MIHKEVSITIAAKPRLSVYSRLKQAKRFKESVFLAVLSLMCFLFSVFRLTYSETHTFLFLNWNLFLAFIPWALSSIITLKTNWVSKKAMLSVLLFTWLLFFPNAPYILTDLFHLRLNSSMPIWFDLVLILSFAWTGLLFGFFSLMDIERLLLRSVNPFWGKVIVSLLLFSGSFGIYLGRYLRWNSWDIISEPFGLVYDIGNRIVNPWEHPRAWGMTLFMGVFLNMIYWSLRLMNTRMRKR